MEHELALLGLRLLVEDPRELVEDPELAGRISRSPHLTILDMATAEAVKTVAETETTTETLTARFEALQAALTQAPTTTPGRDGALTRLVSTLSRKLPPTTREAARSMAHMSAGELGRNGHHARRHRHAHAHGFAGTTVAPGRFGSPQGCLSCTRIAASSYPS